MHGLILLDKPAGITSFGAVAEIRKLTGKIKAGHTGTLDPMATGVLPVLIGRATALSSFLTDEDKRYTAGIRLGISTDTQDITGKVISESDLNISPQQFEKALENFRGEILQTPPMYSAVKVEGVRLYKLARKGLEIERPARKVTIYSLDIIGRQGEKEYLLDIHCSKGTYIRTLINDIGEYLGCGAVLTTLRRTMSAGFNISDCVSLENIRQNGIEKYLLPSDKAVLKYPRADITLPQAVRFTNGGALFLNRVNIKGENEGFARVYCAGSFVGMGQIDTENGLLKIKCLIQKIDRPGIGKG
ncbi:MAG TPA: tRNA pseudouridine(55) synthase TruB [Clostridiales bacterium]|nr:tRNA pseudouridine(55) synthase TruB [Clostridiales bacterium]